MTCQSSANCSFSALGSSGISKDTGMQKIDASLGTTATTATGPNLDTATSYEQSRRQISSVVLSEELLGPTIENRGGTRYIEVPVVHDVVKHVPKVSVVETEKLVPKYDIEYTERIVEVPQVQYVDRCIERQEIQEVFVHVPKKEIREIPIEITRTVPKIEYVTVEKTIEVPGDVVEVPEPFLVENKIEVQQYTDKEVPVVVAQTIRPIVTASDKTVDIDLYEYEPQIILVDVHVAKPVPSHLIPIGATDKTHQRVSVPAAQYNSLLRSLNPHLISGDSDCLPYIREGVTIPFLSESEVPGVVLPVDSSLTKLIGNTEGDQQLYNTEYNSEQCSEIIRHATGSQNDANESSKTWQIDNIAQDICSNGSISHCPDTPQPECILQSSSKEILPISTNAKHQEELHSILNTNEMAEILPQYNNELKQDDSQSLNCHSISNRPVEHKKRTACFC